VITTASLLAPTDLLSVIARNPPLVSPDTSVMAAIAMMGETDSNYVLVVENVSEKSGLLGILSERDLIRIVTQPISLEQLPIQSVMSHPVITIQESTFTDINDALALLQQHHIRHLPVLDDRDRIVGLLDQSALIKMANLADRRQAEAALQQLNQDLERQVEQRTAALQASEATIRTILETIPDLLLRLQRDGNCLAYIKSDIEAENFLPIVNHISEVLPPNLLQRQLQFIEQAITTGELQVYEHHFLKQDRLVYEEVRILAINDQEVLAIVRNITARKLAETALQQLNQDLERRVEQRTEALRRSEERTHATLLALPDLVFRVNRDGEYIDFLTSPQGKNLVDPQQIIGKSIFDALSANIIPSHSEAKYNALQQALTTQTLQTYEQQVWIDGELRYEEVRVAPCNNDEVVFLIRDISDRKLVEKALLESQQFIQTVVDTVPLSLFWKNRESVYLGCNQQFAKVFGLTSVEEIIGKTDFDLPSTQAEIIAHRADDQRVMEAGQARQGIEETITLPNGEQRWVETHKAPLRDWTDYIIGLVGILQDVTIRRQIELRLKYQADQERILGAITQRMRSSLDLTEILNATVEDVREVLQSDRVLIYQLIAGEPKSALAESTLPNCSKLLNIVFPEDIISQDSYNHYTQGDVFILCDLEAKNPSDLPSWVEFLTKLKVRAALAVPIIQDQILWGLLIVHQCDSPRYWQDLEINLLQQISNWLAIAIQQASLHKQLQSELVVRQQTEIKLTKSNQELSVFNEELGRATRLKDEFLANMSHELRTPLNAILGMTEGLQEKVFGAVNERQIKALETVERSSNHLLELINDILDIAKIESGQMVLDCNLCTVASLCQSSLAFIKQQALKKRIQLEIKLQLNLPQLLVDERRIRQVLINLLNNALKFTPEGGRITLEVHQLPPELDRSSLHFLQIAVIDTGIGISAENIKKLFQPFIQIDSALNRQYDGTGLGLALVKRIVELHGGRVGLTSELGVGSRFTIELPCALDDSMSPDLSPHRTADMNLTATPEPNFSSPDNAARSHLILIAEDNEANIGTFSSYLTAKGYRILIAKDGQEALDLAKAHHPDLILMDIQMPIMDGLEATRQIRRDPDLVKIPIIALTALAMTGDRERCLDAGANDYLTKPVKLKLLVTTMQQLLA
jgi:PAS domain S-box-containing protein